MKGSIANPELNLVSLVLSRSVLPPCCRLLPYEDNNIVCLTKSSSDLRANVSTRAHREEDRKTAYFKDLWKISTSIKMVTTQSFEKFLLYIHTVSKTSTSPGYITSEQPVNNPKLFIFYL